MATKYPNLLSPIKLGDTWLRNRIITAPTTIHSASNGEQYPTEEAIVHFANRAKAGAALVTCAGVSFVPTEDDGEHTSWDVYKFNSLNALAHLAECIHFHGAKASMELGGGGMTGGGYAVSDGAPLINLQPGREMPVEEIYRLVKCYADAAEALKSAGFDGLFLHFGHGLQVAQFLSPLTNKRTDEFGGSLENRARYPIMAVDAIRERVGRDMLIEVRISGTEIEEGGFGVEEAIAFTEMIQDKIDMIQVSCGMHNPKYMTVVHPCGFLPPIPNVYLAEAFKKSGRIKIPVVTIGGIQDLDEAEQILVDGRADILAIARGVIADTDLVNKAYAGRNEDVTPCIKCLRCLDSGVFGHKFLCAVNPVIGMEHVLPTIIKPPKAKKKVAIIGGGPAGMEAALTASQRGHDVTLFEKSVSLGGALKYADNVSFKYPLKNFKNYLVRQIEKSDIHIRLNTEATPEMIETGKYDTVYAAIGAKPIISSIKGIDAGNVNPAVETYGREGELGERIVVIGGGQVGCETALHLAKLGKKVTIVEMLPELAPDASPTHRTELLQELDNEANLTYLTNNRCNEITENCVVCASGSIEAESVILATGMRALSDEAEAFRPKTGDFVAIGDCVRARTVENAIKEAYYAAVRL
jgi:2,4-dienoyl-CoA reductase-like NADH-dependent reductase (Old Yellow Enzyme family)/thioredoxin reductase